MQDVRVKWVLGRSNFCEKSTITDSAKITKINNKNNNSNGRKLKAMGKLTLITDHYPRKRLMGNTDSQSGVSCYTCIQGCSRILLLKASSRLF